ncbi:MAG: hypothetical protein KHZ24_01145 [Coriobacteriia bacterium]|nr:hypothetical protein [Coriobacteriia bacterium]
MISFETRGTSMNKQGHTEKDTPNVGLRIAAVGGLAVVPLVLAIAGCSIPKLGTELDGSNPAATASSAASEETEHATTSVQDATSSAAQEEETPLPVRYGTVYSEVTPEGVTISTPHYDVVVPDGTLPEGWSFTYRDAYTDVRSMGVEMNDLGLLSGRALTFYDADGAEVAQVLCASGNWDGLTQAYATYNTGLTLPDEPTTHIVVAVPYPADAVPYADAFDDQAAKELAGALSITPKLTVSSTAFGSTAKDGEADSTGASAPAGSSAKSSFSRDRVGASDGEVGSGTHVVATPLSPYDASGKVASVAQTSEGTSIYTPYYAVTVPADLFKGAWDYTYSDVLLAQDGDNIAGHALTIYPMGSPASLESVTFFAAKGDPATLSLDSSIDLSDAEVQAVGALAADPNWTVYVAVRNPYYGPHAATGISDFYDAASSRQDALDAWADALDVACYASTVSVVEAPASSLDGAASSSSHESAGLDRCSASSSAKGDAMASSGADPIASTDGEVGGNAELASEDGSESSLSDEDAASSEHDA